jgi:hypothetical protein
VKLLEDQIFRYTNFSDINDDEYKSVIMQFIDKIEKPSLNVKVNDAISLRNKGHFNKAMLNISEANRDQVIAIRKIQRILDEASGTEIKEVVFSKYRQFFPLEIGIENGDEVIKIIDDLLIGGDRKVLEIKNEIHSLEIQKEEELERLTFFEQRFGNQIEDDEINEIRENLKVIEKKINEIKGLIVSKIFEIVNMILKDKTNLDNKDLKILDLTWNIFFVFMSPIATKYPGLVDVEK